MTAKSIDEAKQALLDNLNLDKFEFYDFEVIQEPTKGFLGIGSRDAEVKLLIRTDKLQKGQFLVTEMSKHLGYTVEFDIKLDESKQELRFNFSGEESNKMFKQIGRGVHKMEFLINCIINRKDRESYLKTVFVHDAIVADSRQENTKGGRRPKRSSNNDRKSRPRRKENDAATQSDRVSNASNIKHSDDHVADVSESAKTPRGRRDKRTRSHGKSRGADFNKDDNFSNSDRKNRRSRNENKTSNAREAYLKNTAKRMAKKVVETKQPVALNPMNSYDRRIIHSTLSEYDNVTTRSNGEDHDRHIVIEYSAE
tara:strand:+ start:3778 stop:4710 length:933 start_codon:yes stop_codon:yes gene_type:complete